MTEPSSENLARALEEAGAPAEMVRLARADHYHDFKSPLAMPEMQLLNDARKHGLTAIADGVLQGKWDATKAESDAWAASPDGQATFAELGPTMAKTVFGIDVSDDIDHDMLLAGAEMVGRAGGREFEVGYLDDDVPIRKARWWARARLHNRPELGDAAGQVVMVEEMPGPDFAAEALARRLLDGGMCTHCRKPIRLGAPRSERNRVCRYVRDGAHWKRGCEE